MEIALALPDFVNRIEARIMGDLARQAEDWSLSRTALNRWEEEHLLDNPTPEVLAQHKFMLEHLLTLGKILSFATTHPDFPDAKLAEIVASTQRVLQDDLTMWHDNTMTKEESESILAEVFPNGSRA